MRKEAKGRQPPHHKVKRSPSEPRRQKIPAVSQGKVEGKKWKYESHGVYQAPAKEKNRVYSKRMVDFLAKHHDGKFAYNKRGLHVLHMIAEKWRTDAEEYNRELFEEAVNITRSEFGHLEVGVLGPYPPAGPTTPFIMACDQAWKAQGSRPADYRACIEYMIDQGANVNAQDNRGNTGLHKAVGSHHMNILDYFIEKAASRKQEKGTFAKGLFNWQIRNDDDWTILNTATGKDGRGKCTAIYKAIDGMVQLGYLQYHTPLKAESSSNKRKWDNPISEKRKQRNEDRQKGVPGRHAR